MATAPYIPASDAGFDTWLNNFATLIAATPTVYGLVAGDATAITAQKTAWNTAYALVVNPATKTSVTVAGKDAARATAEAVVRPYAVQISNNSGVDPSDKTAVGVTVKKTIPTPVPPPTTSPTLSLVTATPLAHQLAYRDTSTPTSKSKPAGAIQIQLNRAVGIAFTVDPEAASFYGMWTKSPNVSSFDAGQAGMKCTYFARWVTRGGPGGASQFGPWSAPLQLMVM